MKTNELFPMIYKRKSFHLFRNIGNQTITQEEIEDIYKAYESFTSVCADIKTAIRIVPSNETSCKRGEEYCILIYSEVKDNYLLNVGYLGEQLDLYLVSKNIGTLWFGLGKTEEKAYEGLEFVIMIAISKVDDESKFRKDMFRSKRKTKEEIWMGEEIEGVTDLVRFAPSACNSQPWIVEHRDDILSVFRYRKKSRIGILPKDKVTFYNRIDIGIFLCFLDICLEHEKIDYECTYETDRGTDEEKTIVVTYHLL